MKHVKEIRELISEGQVAEARDALDVLLEFGPSNVEALKIKALLANHFGKFEEEEDYWRKVLTIDSEDFDAISFFLQKHVDEKERHFFTDVLPQGGRRFLTYPRALVKFSFLGLLGCMAFLVIMNFAERHNLDVSPTFIMSAFVALVITPWFGIIATYLRAIKSICVQPDGIFIETRLKSMLLRWDNLEKICLSHSNNPDTPDLKLVFVPKDNTPIVTIDMNQHSSSVRARPYLVGEIRQFYKNLTHEAFDSLGLKNRAIKSY
ncbi:MAG: hypothetical protein AB7T49_12700 [Oligoflexales bacterium]